MDNCNNRNRRSASVPREFESRQGPAGGCSQNSGYGNFQYPRYNNNNNNNNNQQYRGRSKLKKNNFKRRYQKPRNNWSKTIDIASSPFSENFAQFLLARARKHVMDLEDGEYPPPLMERFRGNRRNFQNQNRWNRNREADDDYRYGFRNNGGFGRRSQSQEHRRGDFNSSWNDEYEDELMIRQEYQPMNQLRQQNRTNINKANITPVPCSSGGVQMKMSRPTSQHCMQLEVPKLVLHSLCQKTIMNAYEGRNEGESRTLLSSGRKNKFSEDDSSIVDDEFDLKMIEAFINDEEFPNRIATLSSSASSDKNNNPEKMPDNRNKPEKIHNDRNRHEKMSDNRSRPEKIPDDRNTPARPKKKKPRLADAHSSSSENPPEFSTDLPLPKAECEVKNPQEFLKYLEETGKLACELRTIPKFDQRTAVGEETVFEIETVYCMVCKVQINKDELKEHLISTDHYRRYHNYLSDLDVVREMQNY